MVKKRLESRNPETRGNRKDQMLLVDNAGRREQKTVWRNKSCGQKRSICLNILSEKFKALDKIKVIGSFSISKNRQKMLQQIWRSLPAK